MCTCVLSQLLRLTFTLGLAYVIMHAVSVTEGDIYLEIGTCLSRENQKKRKLEKFGAFRTSQIIYKESFSIAETT